MTQEEIILYLKHKATLTNPSPNRFIKEVKTFLDNFKKINNLKISDYKLLFYMYINNITKIPQCRYENCKNDVRFLTFSKGFSYGCSHSHAKIYTNIKKFGSKTPFESKSIQQKVKKTYLNKYGNEKPTLTKNFKVKMLKKFGYEYPMQSIKIKTKLVTTMNEKYGGMGNKSSLILSKTQRTRKINYLLKLDSTEYPAIRLFGDVEFRGVHGWNNKYSWQCKACGTIYDATITDGQLPRCNQCYPRLITGISQAEQELFKSLKSETKIQSDKTVLNGKEIDVYIPDKHLAIEYNGIYWHSEGSGSKTRNYHLNKTEMCLEKGINLIHIFENEWLENKKNILSFIHSQLTVYEKIISSDECFVSEISQEIKDEFVNDNHIKKSSKTNLQIGLFNDGELIQILSLNKTSENTYGIIENVVKSGYTIKGGTKKLWNFFINVIKPNNVIFTDDKRYKTIMLYKDIDFKLEKVIPPQPWFHTPKTHKLESLEQWSERNEIHLENLDSIFKDYIQNTNQDIIWDCGYDVYIWCDRLTI